MSEAPAAPAANRLKSTPGVNWAAGLVAAIVLGHILGLITVAITNEWLLWIALGFTGLILAGVVGFVVLRLVGHRHEAVERRRRRALGQRRAEEAERAADETRRQVEHEAERAARFEEAVARDAALRG